MNRINIDYDSSDSNDNFNDGNNSMSKLLELVLSSVQNALIYGYRVRFLHSLAYQLATIKPQSNIIEIFLKVWKSIKMGLDHGKILAFFALIYRCSLVLVKKLNFFSNKNNKLVNNFIAGFIGGILIYSGIIQRKIIKNRGKIKVIWIKKLFLMNENILTQITMYTMSRLIIAFGRDIAYLTLKRKNSNQRINKLQKNKQVEKITDISWTICCGIIWGGIMVYYQRDRKKDSNDDDDNNNNNNNNKPLYLPRALQFSLDFIYGGVTHAWKEAFDYNNR